MEKALDNFYKCDSCEKLFPEGLIKEIKFSYNTRMAGAREKLMTETMHGLICIDCGKERPISLDVPTPQGKATVTKKTYGRK